MKQDFPNLVKEIDFQEVQEAQRVPKKLDLRKHTPMYSIITLPKIKDRERIFFKFLLLFNYSCMPFLPIPPPHPS